MESHARAAFPPRSPAEQHAQGDAVGGRRQVAAEEHVPVLHGAGSRRGRRRRRRCAAAGAAAANRGLRPSAAIYRLCPGAAAPSPRFSMPAEMLHY
jgi:hypothetical protein